MGDLSAHFSSAEFRCKCTAAGHGPHAAISRRLVEALERLRKAKGGRPLRIESGVRCQAHNRHVGGATRSQHLSGTAADIPEGYATEGEARAAGFTGIGLRRGWAVHVDVRASPARWTY